MLRLRIHAPKGLHSSYLSVVDVAFGSGADERAHGAVQLDLSRELQLPRVWSESVQALGLRDAEHNAWEELRSYIVAEQRAGVDGDIELVRLHRFLGYADERRGDMPLACELMAQGYDLRHGPPATHPRASEFEAVARRWRLLLQLSLGPDLGLREVGGERLYLWVPAADLAVGDYRRVRAIRR